MIGQAGYRIRQFWNIFDAGVSRDEHIVLQVYLNLEQQQLFWGMAPLGRRHCLNVHHALAKGGHDDPDLLRAALLHDIGKGRSGVLSRVTRVLFGAMAPRSLGWLARRNHRLGALLDHAQRGAVLVEATGASDAMVDIIRWHERGQLEDPRLVALRSADSQN